MASSCSVKAMCGVVDEVVVTIPYIFDGNESFFVQLWANERVHLMQVGKQPKQPAGKSADNQDCLDNTFIFSSCKN